MGFLMLLKVASMPILQVLIISLLGAFLATGSSKILHTQASNSLNKIVFMVFTPSLTFASLAKTVTLRGIISWWYMPVNIGLTFLIGGALGWILVKLLKPDKSLEGLIIAISSAGNLGNLPLVIVPAICEESGSPFGELEFCRSAGVTYSSLSMALGNIFLWTYTYHLVRTSAIAHNSQLKLGAGAKEVAPAPHSNKNLEVTVAIMESSTAPLLKADHQNPHSHHSTSELSSQVEYSSAGRKLEKVAVTNLWDKVIVFFHQILEELLTPPTLAAIVGFIFGATTWLKNLIIGEDAPLRVIQDSMKLLGGGTIPCMTLILGGNLTKGFKSARIKPGVIIGVLCVRYLMLPVVGIGVVKAAASLQFLPSDPLYCYTLMLQFALPPAMSIGTMTQLFDVGQEECSVLLMWAYSVAALALTLWSTVYMWALSS